MTDTYRDLIAEIDRAVAPPVAGEFQSPHRPAIAMLMEANAALRALSDPARQDFPEYLHRQTQTRLARAELNAASATVELRVLRERCAELMSQHEPLAGLGIDRELVRQVLHYVIYGRLK